MALATHMPETPDELAGFIRGVVDRQVIELQRETLEEMRRLGERQARVEGRVEGLGQTIELYREDFGDLREDFRRLTERQQIDFQGLREDFRSLLDRFDHFQGEMRREYEVFRQDIRAENEKFRQEIREEHGVFCQEVRAENEKFRQEVWGRFERIDERFERIDERFKRIDERFDKIDERFERINERFERIEGRLFEMQKSLTTQTRWLVVLLVAAPVIYSVMEKVLGRLFP